MRSLTLSLQCVLLVALLAASQVAFAQPYGYSVNSRGDFAQDEKVGALWTIDLATGEASRDRESGDGKRTRISDDYIFVEGLAFLPDGRLLGADDHTNTLILIGLNSGSGIPFGSPAQDNNMGLPAGVHDFGMTFTCEGELLVSSDSLDLGQNLYRANLETGALSLVGDLGAPIVDLAAIGQQIFGIGRGIHADGSSYAPNLYLIDPDVPSATLIGPLGSAAGPYNKAGLAADEDGSLWAITDRRSAANHDVSQASEILRIDPETGAATLVAAAFTDEGGEALVGIESLAITTPLSCDVESGSGQEPGTADEVHSVPVFSDATRLVLILLLLLVAGLRLRAP